MQSVFMIDLPRKVQHFGNKEEAPSTPFQRELVFFLHAQQLDEDVTQGIMKFDFSNTKHLAFVHSVGGAHFSEDMERTGYLGLNNSIKELGLQTSISSLRVDYAASSLGALSDKYLRSLFQAASGNSMEHAKGRLPLEEQFRIYFPTDETVENSTGGKDSAGTIRLQPKYYHSAVFPRTRMRDYQSARVGLLSHNKMLYARGSSTASEVENQHPVAWAYLGSANLSESAWGSVVYDRQRRESKLSCRNWECGVVVPVLGPSTDEKTTTAGGPGSNSSCQAGIPEMEVFASRVPVPFEVPGKLYRGRHPWMYPG